MRRTLIVLAEAPIPGEVKANLSPPLELSDAARLHECFMLDVLDKAATVPDVELVVAYTPWDALCYFRGAAPTADLFIARTGDNLGEDLASCLQDTCEAGKAVVAISDDHPTVPAKSLELAFDALASGKVDIVIGPSSEGGIYLVGMTACHPEILDGELTPESIMERAAVLGLGWYILPPSQGVNSPEDLEILKSEMLDELPYSRFPQHTRMEVAALAGSGVI